MMRNEGPSEGLRDLYRSSLAILWAIWTVLTETPLTLLFTVFSPLLTPITTIPICNWGWSLFGHCHLLMEESPPQWICF